MQLFRDVRVRIQLLWVLDVESFEALIKDGIGGFDLKPSHIDIRCLDDTSRRWRGG